MNSPWAWADLRQSGDGQHRSAGQGGRGRPLRRCSVVDPGPERQRRALDEAGICRAAIESLSENFSDGIVAPAFWIGAGGLAGGVLYKAVNTADSMVGHRTPRHEAQFRREIVDNRVRIEALDAGGFLRFLDLYGQIRGGVLNASLAGAPGGQLSGPVQMTGFSVFDEPKLSQLVSTRGDGTASLSEAVRRDIDTREVVFDVAQANAVFAPGGLSIGQGIVRGPMVGFALQGQVYDRDGEMRMTGTFMPAYGVNSLFSEIPILGLFLGNGRERGLIGVTFKLEGSFERPQITVNPLSVIAPGLFRSIFEFR